LGPLGSFLVGLSLVACEDGPNQTYSPAPAGAGNNWNNGRSDPSVGHGPASFGSGFGSITPLELCTADKQRVTWAKLLTQPIVPGDPKNNYHPTFAGIDLAGPDWGGITFESAEEQLCSGTDIGAAGDGMQPATGACFGDNCEFLFAYVNATHVVNQVVLNLGYTGACDFTSDPKGGNPGHSYHAVIGQQIQKDNQPFEIDWTDAKLASLMEIYNGMLYTFGGPGIYTGYDSLSCSSDSSCLVYPPSVAPSNGNECIFGVRQLLTYWLWSCPNTLQPTVSTIVGMYYDFGKVMPYSHMGQDLRIDAVGPSTYAKSSQDQKAIPLCNLYVGLSFGDFLANCGVKIRAPSNVLWQKLTGGHTHDDDDVQFNVIGINTSWTDELIETPESQGVVTDSYLPSDTDLATDWSFDVRTFSTPDNDDTSVQNAGGSPYGPFRGTGLVQREWGRLVEADASQQLLAQRPSLASVTGFPHFIGDPACRVEPVAANALGCTGFEGFAIGGMPEPGDNGDGCNNPLGNGTATCQGTADGCFGNICDNIVHAGTGWASLYYAAYYSSALQPGDPTSVFCQDPAIPSQPGNCVGGAMWNQARLAVLQVAGLGNVKTLPQELRDYRYYFRWWGIAMIKYYKAYGAHPAPYGTSGFVTAGDVAGQGIDLTSLFFDNNSSDGFDKDEYIDRSVMSDIDVDAATKGGPVHIPACNAHSPGYPCSGPGKGDPTHYPAPASIAMDFNYGSDVIAANQRYSDWFRRMDREEAAMFRSMLVDKKHLPGSENTVNLTNLAGNPLLASNYTSYECATQWPKVTIIGNGSVATPMIDAADWAAVCETSCPAFPLLPGVCPYPPGVSGNTSIDDRQLDQNGSLAGTGAAGISNVTANGSIIKARPRLAAYPAVWGGTGAWCPGSGPAGDHEGYSYDQAIVGGTPNNPYQGGCLYNAVMNTHGSVYQVGGKSEASARLSFIPSKTSKTGTDPELLTAFVNIPNMPNPFNDATDIKIPSTQAPLTDAGNLIHVTVPWTKSIEGVGFNIPLSGTISKFVQTAQLDFTGVMETYLLDYVPHVPKGAKTTDGTIDILAIEGDDFLGEVFLCQDTADTNDLLGVKMYDAGGAILDWLTAHPGTQDSCNIIVQYSPYGNFLDVVASISTGVTVYINQGSGYGRVVGVQAFDPLLAQTP
jgi:hypothetical protein